MTILMVLLYLYILSFSNIPESIIITLIKYLYLTNLLLLDFKVALIFLLNITPESYYLILITACLLS